MKIYILLEEDQKVIFGQTEVFYDLKIIHNSFVEVLNGVNTYEIFPPYFDQPTTSIPPYLIMILKDLGKLNFSTFLN